MVIIFFFGNLVNVGFEGNYFGVYIHVVSVEKKDIRDPFDTNEKLVCELSVYSTFIRQIRTYGSIK